MLFYIHMLKYDSKAPVWNIFLHCLLYAVINWLDYGSVIIFMVEKKETFYRLKRSNMGKTRNMLQFTDIQQRRKRNFLVSGSTYWKIMFKQQDLHYVLISCSLINCSFVTFKKYSRRHPLCMPPFQTSKIITKALSEYVVCYCRYYLDDSTSETSGSVFALRQDSIPSK
jgi:hypothetical protein